MFSKSLPFLCLKLNDGYSVKTVLYPLLALCGHFFSAISVPFIMVSILSFGTIPSIIAYIFLAFFIGTRMRALGNIIHECAHNSFFQQKKWNIIIGELLCAMHLSSFQKYKKNHLRHHKYLGQERDPDFLNFKLFSPNFQKLYSYNLITLSYNFFYFIFNPLHWVSISYSHVNFLKKPRELRTIVFSSIFILVFLFFFYKYFYIILFFYVIPYLTFYPMLRLFSDYMDHGKGYRSKNFFDKTENHIFKFNFLNWLLFPRNDGYHLVHHLYPKVSINQLPGLHKKLMQEKNMYAQKNHDIG